MSSVNKVILIGNLGGDPELFRFENGNAKTTFRIATNEKWKDRDGKLQERTEWHTIVTFGATAENCDKYLSKGRSVYVEGKIQTREYEKDGQTRYITEIVGTNVTFLSGGSDTQNPPNGQRRTNNSRPGPSRGQSAFDDDIPF